jgi:hypothetical protein
MKPSSIADCRRKQVAKVWKTVSRSKVIVILSKIRLNGVSVTRMSLPSNGVHVMMRLSIEVAMTSWAGTTDEHAC